MPKISELTDATSLDGTETLPLVKGTSTVKATISKILGALVATKGDLLAATNSLTVGKLAAGTNGQILTADSSTTTGLKWIALPDPTLATIPAGSTITVLKDPSTGNWPGGTSSTAVRPTSRTDIVVQWKGADPSPPIVSSGTAGMLANVDLRLIT